MERIIGKVSIAGVEYKIIDNTESLQEKKLLWDSCNFEYKIYVITSYYGKQLSNEMVKNYIFRGIIDIMLYNLMFKSPNMNGYIISLSSYITQVIEQYNKKPNKLKQIKLGGTTWTISYSKKLDKPAYYFGLCKPSTFEIELVTHSVNSDKEIISIKEEQLFKTFLHEVFHAIFYLTGDYNKKINSESHVNILSIQLAEVINTLNVKINGKQCN